MTDVPTADPPAQLAGSRARPRTRIAVGAAVAAFVIAVAASAIAGMAGAGGGHAVLRPEPSSGAIGATGAPPDGAPVAAVDAAAPPTVLVHVLGAVARPGIVELAAGARVVDAVAAAGGLTDDADPAGVNLARTLADGEQLVVPREGEAPPPAAAGAGGGSSAAGGRVSLNRAGIADLDTLPRIGPALAQRIVDWREANGPFTDVSQLLEVAGIGDAVYAGLVDLVSL
ncbi:hypothetical protein GCM10009819_01390 [Agromyces tropicus]|uniref:Soluble ligand binding domain-containing protein n=1 Tax=Agromyces tropicus TaxID=555371 RepID=A0ABN2TW24_9MICO